MDTDVHRPLQWFWWLLAAMPVTVTAMDLRDPFGDLAAIPSLQETGRPCPETLPSRPLHLADVVDTALCRNPQTALSWAAARTRAAAVGSARSAYLPDLSVSGSITEDLGGDSTSTFGAGSVGGGGFTSSSSSNDTTRASASITLSYLLFDFGARGAALDAARALLDAARHTRNATLQRVYLDAVTRYYDWVAAAGSVDAATEAERAARSSLEAASAREQIGTATRADRLQAQTALAQAELTRVRARGALRTALGSLSNVMGLPAQQGFELAPAPEVGPQEDFIEQLDGLVDRAAQARPDLAAATASLQAAERDVDAARAQGRPRLSAQASQSYSWRGDREADSASVGLSVSIPVFTGYADTYRVRSAEAQLESSKAELQRLSNQVSLEVYQAHSELQTQTQSVFTARALVQAAQESESVARGRYEAGVGTILDLLDAQSSAADARRQLLQSRTDWASARTRLAQAVGTLDAGAEPGGFTVGQARDGAQP